MKELEVVNFTKTELNHTDRPLIILYEQSSVAFDEYEYGLFMYDGNLYMKTSKDEFYNVSDPTETHHKIQIEPTIEIYPLIPNHSQLVKNTLNKYSKVLENGYRILEEEELLDNL